MHISRSSSAQRPLTNVPGDVELECQGRINEIRKNLSAPELRLKNDWDFLSRFINYVRDLFHVKRAFITLVKEENVLEMFDPQEPHSIKMAQDEGMCQHTLRSPDGVSAVPDMNADERYANASIRSQALEGTTLMFYAGATLNIDLHSDTHSSNGVIGVLCLLDDVAHEFGTEHLRRLKSIADLLSGQIVQQIAEQHSRRQARMHQVTIEFMNTSLQLVNTEESGMCNTSQVRLPVTFPVFTGGSEDPSSESVTLFVTPQLMGQKMETTLYRDALNSICNVLEDSSAVLLDLSRYDTTSVIARSPEPGATQYSISESGSEASSSWTSRHSKGSLTRSKSTLRNERDMRRSWSQVANYTHASRDASPFKLEGTQGSAGVDAILLHTLTSDDHWFHAGHNAGEHRAQILRQVVSGDDAAGLLAIPVKQGKHSLLLMLVWQEVPARRDDIAAFATGILSSLVNTLSMRDARRSERAQLTFSNVQAHELRTPLHQIMSTTSLLRTELTEPLAINGPGASGMVIDLLNNLESANTHLERNISSILGYFSSLAMDYTSNDAQVIADALPAKTLGQLLESTLPRLMQQNRAMQREYISGDVDVIVDFVKPYLETDVFEDADGSLMRIIEPLFMNALTFRRESHSYVKVSITDEMHLLPTFSGVLDKDLVNVSIRIEDNGIGMSESFLQQDYFKAMGKQDEFSGGTGLSLYLAQELLHLMGGRIAVTSALGKGTVVFIEVPLSHKSPRADLLPTPRLTPTLFRRTDFCLYVQDAAPSTVPPSRGRIPILEDSIRNNLLSFGLTICSEWRSSQLLLVRNDLSVEAIGRIAEEYRGKEVWVVGPEDGWEKWGHIAAKFEIIHLGNFIVSTTIRQLITAAQTEMAIPMDLPSISRLFPAKFTLPTMAGPQARMKRADLELATEPVSFDMNKPFIMVVDDNHINRKILVQNVKKLGLEVLQADDGLGAVDLFKKHRTRPAIILLDINMPGLNGYDACVQMRDLETHDQSKPSYIIAVTALGRSDQRDRGLNECGMNEWVTKPTGRESIIKAVTAGISYFDNLP